MNFSAVPGCSALTGIANTSLPTGHPSSFFWNWIELGIVDAVADVDHVAVPEVLDPGVAR